MVTLTLRALAERVMRSDIATVANQESALPGVTKMSTQTLTPARSRLNASYRNLTLWTLQGWIAMFFIAAGYATEVVERVLRLVRISEWKRHQAAPGPKVSRRAFGRERRYPITNGYQC